MSVLCFVAISERQPSLPTSREMILDERNTPWNTPPFAETVKDQTTNPTKSHRPPSLLDTNTIQQHLLAEAPWAESHGADHFLYLGGGLLYYSFAYAFQSKTIVVLGSGGGFVPRLLRQAQRDVQRSVAPFPRDSSATSATTTTNNHRFELILIDAHLPSAGWGSTFYMENNGTIMREQFSDITYVLETTDKAIEKLRRERGPDFKIDYLHVDADHSYEQSLKDFDNYYQLLAPRGVVSFHDTCSSEERHCRTGVPQTIATIRQRIENGQLDLQLMDAHYLYRGLAFAIRGDAPALDAPSHRRYNFCNTNAQRLQKQSSGFSQNARVGSLSTLGDFYECNTRFNMTALAKDRTCPFGTRRDKKGQCSLCIKGMQGPDCQDFRYDDKRQAVIGNAAFDEPLVRQVTRWFETYNAQHVLAIGTEATHLLPDDYNARTGQTSHGPPLVVPPPFLSSFTAVDPLLPKPVWSEHDAIPQIRKMPCKLADLIGSKDRDKVYHLNHMDTIVCLDCATTIPNGAALRSVVAHALASSVTNVLIDVSDDKAGTTFVQDFLQNTLGDATTWWIVDETTLNGPQRQRHLVLLQRTYASNTAATE